MDIYTKERIIRIGLYFLIVMSVTTTLMIKSIPEKSYYELKLNNDVIIRDSLQESWDYFYNEKGERYYKSNIIYSKKLNK